MALTARSDAKNRLGTLLLPMHVISTPVAQGLQIAGWLLTITGHVQITHKARTGFLTWIAANGVLIALSAYVGLWWSIGMFLTNTGICAWSCRRWPRERARQMSGAGMWPHAGLKG